MLLRADAVSFGYRARPVLHDVDLTVPRGGLVGVLGPNGSGKTTLLKLLAGVLTPTKGRITLEGKDTAKLDRTTLARYLAVVPQETQLTFDYTVLEIILMGRHPHLGTFELEGTTDLEIARRMLVATGTEALEQRMFRTLSGGEKQRVAIARTLAQDPQLLLLDEPFGALDAQVTWEMEEMVIEIIESESKTVVLVTHDIQEAIYLADRIIFFTRQPGRIKADLPMEFKGGKRFPKKEDLLSHPGYVEMEKRLYGMMREEIQGRIS